MNKLIVNSVTKRFGSKELLKDVSFECSTNEIIGVFGRNGCGKSTLLKILFGLLKADSITASINNIAYSPATNIPDGLIAYLPQDSFLPKSSKVRDIVPLYFSSAEKQDKILYYKGIDKIANTKSGNLSLGEIRYFELILVAHLSHPFLMLDEPFSMIEPLYKEYIKEFLTELKTIKGIIATDHYFTDILDITNRNFMIKEGVSISVNNRTDLVSHGYVPK